MHRLEHWAWQDQDVTPHRSAARVARARLSAAPAQLSLGRPGSWDATIVASLNAVPDPANASRWLGFFEGPSPRRPARTRLCPAGATTATYTARPRSAACPRVSSESDRPCFRPTLCCRRLPGGNTTTGDDDPPGGWSLGPASTRAARPFSAAVRCPDRGAPYDTGRGRGELTAPPASRLATAPGILGPWTEWPANPVLRGNRTCNSSLEQV
jgi:hypothetical protein